MSLRISICDDDEQFLKEFSNYLNQFSFKENIGIDIACFTDGESLLSAIDSENGCDICFLDIELPDLNGINAAKKINKKNIRKPYIVFVSSYPEYMHDSFSAHPYYFLKKPVTASDLEHVLSDILADMNSSTPFITIEDTSEATHIIYLCDILYLKSIDSKRKRILIHTKERDYEIYGLISDWTDKLSTGAFVNCYRGIIINLRYIHSVAKGIVIMQDGTSFPISRGKEQLLQKKYINQVIRS